MRIISDPDEMQDVARTLRGEGRRIGFVPTMGALHEGHRSLLRIARKHADIVVVSLFVNPSQFGPGEDFAVYPRDFDGDEALCRAERADVLFCPSADTLYARDHSVFVAEDGLAAGLCGRSRPGHFRGVCTVVAKLFHLVQPDVAVFGEKDAQQLRVVRRMVRDLNFPVQIVAGPTVRAPDGLALSSRNARLSPAGRAKALCLRRALDVAERRFAAGERDAARVRDAAAAVLAAEAGVELDYLEIVDDETLAPVTRLDEPALVAVAARVEGVRLIDNTVLGRSQAW